MKNDQEFRSGWEDYITNVNVNVSDIRSITMGSLLDLKKDLKRAVKKYSDNAIKSRFPFF